MISKGVIVTKIIFSDSLINLRKIRTSSSRILRVFWGIHFFLRVLVLKHFYISALVDKKVSLDQRRCDSDKNNFLGDLIILRKSCTGSSRILRVFVGIQHF